MIILPTYRNIFPDKTTVFFDIPNHKGSIGRYRTTDRIFQFSVSIHHTVQARTNRGLMRRTNETM